MPRTITRKERALREILLCALSAVLLVLSFPPTDFAALAWIALIPLFIALDGKRLFIAFWQGYLSGILFFTATMYWIIHVTLGGMILLQLYLAIYFGVFAYGYVFSQKRSVLIRMFFLPSLWVALEYIRGHFLSGFNWASLGLSQYQNLSLIQICDVTGMWGISFLLVMANVLIKEFYLHREDPRWPLPRTLAVPLIVFLSILLFVFGYGEYRLNQTKTTKKIKVAIIQGNIPLEDRWNSAYRTAILSKYFLLTEEALREKPQLIIWPESTFPVFIFEDPKLFEDLKNKVKAWKTPLLLGIVTNHGEEYFNAAMMISKEGQVVKEHHKMHLVPFGEYIPFRKDFPFLANIVPIDDFTAGQEFTLFPLELADPSLRGLTCNILICFEDTVGELSREFVLEGSNLLVNVTNDAWFKDTKAPILHLQGSVFRTVENKRTLIRATNTGVSCFINPQGKIEKCLENDRHKRTYVEGYAVQEVLLNEEKTFYTKYGDIFTYLCFGCILLVAINRIASRRHNS